MNPHNQRENSTDPGTSASPEDYWNLDILSAINASRAFAGEIIADELLKKLIVILLEHGDGQWGGLLIPSEDSWVVKATAGKGDAQGTVIDEPSSTSSYRLSQSTIDSAIHSRETVIHHCGPEKEQQNENSDPERLRATGKSILCMPIMHQEEILCLLYLENNPTGSGFLPGRREILNLLASQAANSIINTRLYEELENTVSQLHREVDKHKKTQIQLLHAGKLSALSRLSASLAHEFGNPLIGITYLLDDLQTRAELGSEDKNLIQAGLEECERMRNLINDLHNLTRPSSGAKTVFSLNDTLRNVLALQRRNLEKNGVRIKMKLAQNIPAIEAVEDQITQVVVNLTINAADSMKKTGGTLFAWTFQEDKNVVLNISDSGSGISAENQEHIFEPFFSTKMEIDGTGLGLSTAYSIVKSHGGDIDFISTAGQGSTFTITLPVAG